MTKHLLFYLLVSSCFSLFGHLLPQVQDALEPLLDRVRLRSLGRSQQKSWYLAQESGGCVVDFHSSSFLDAPWLKIQVPGRSLCLLSLFADLFQLTSGKPCGLGGCSQGRHKCTFDSIWAECNFFLQFSFSHVKLHQIDNVEAQTLRWVILLRPWDCLRPCTIAWKRDIIRKAKWSKMSRRDSFDDIWFFLQLGSAILDSDPKTTWLEAEIFQSCLDEAREVEICVSLFLSVLKWNWTRDRGVWRGRHPNLGDATWHGGRQLTPVC